jgi:4-nitrophenyl phosphatase
MTLNRQQDILRAIKHLVVDMDGVLYRGMEPIPGTAEFLDFLRQRQIGFVLATNNATRTPQQFVDKLAGMGVRVEPHEILTSSQATATYLAGITPPGTRVFVVGQTGLRTALQGAGFELVEDGADFVVVGMDFEVCYQRLAEATLQIRAGAHFIGTNPDRTFPSERGIVPGAGSLLAFLEAATDVKPTIIGKPEKTLMEQALARLGGMPSTAPAVSSTAPAVSSTAPAVSSTAPGVSFTAAVLGDRLETDILAGQRAGMTTLLVLTGVTTRKMLVDSEMQPDLVFDDVAHLHAVWKEAL